jgi:DNA invertase Pin-like site-specific DNA recombinase
VVSDRRRGVIYGRQSRTSETSTSREDQVAACQAEAERHGVEVSAVLVEPPSTSAFKKRGKNRPLWPELLDLVRLGKVDVVVAYKTDRLSRGGGPGWAPLIEAAEDAGLDPDRFVLIVGSGYMREFELGIRASMDREESKKISDRAVGIHERRAGAGKPSMGGSRPFGYRADRVTVDEEEAALLVDAARRILAGETPTAICWEWNQAGYRTTTGRQWRATSLHHTLCSPRVAGLRQHGTVKGPGRQVAAVTGMAAWPALLDRVTWEALKAVLQKPHGRRARQPVALLVGLLRCGRCGQPIRAGANAEGKRRYCCNRQPGEAGCGRCSILAEPTERYVVEHLFDIIESPRYARLLAERAQASSEDAHARAESELVDAEARFDRLKDAYGRGDISDEDWPAVRRGAAARVEAARAAVAPLREVSALADIADLSELRCRWDDLSLDRQRAIAAAVIDHVTVDPGPRGPKCLPAQRLHITWKA